MTAFINGELPPKSRQRMARYIDECPDCYDEYQRQLEIQQELTRQLPVFGKPEDAQLGRMWDAIQGSMNLSAQGSQNRHTYRIRYALMTGILALFLILPFMLGNRGASPVLATQPTPNSIVIDRSTDFPNQPTMVAIATLTETMAVDDDIITPEAATQSAP